MYVCMFVVPFDETGNLVDWRLLLEELISNITKLKKIIFFSYWFIIFFILFIIFGGEFA